MSSLIGALRVTLSADTANFEAGMAKARGASATAASGIQNSMGLIKSAVSGLIAGLSVGLFTHIIKDALEFAGTIAHTAIQLGVTTRELQIFTYAAKQSGVSTEGLHSALARLSISMSKAASGSEPTIKSLRKTSSDKTMAMPRPRIKAPDQGRGSRPM